MLLADVYAELQLDTIYDTTYNIIRRVLMSKRDKLLLKLRNNPTNAKFETIQSLLLHFGFKERAPRGGSSHYTYTYKGTIITIPKHKPVKAIYIKKVLALLEELNLIEKE